MPLASVYADRPAIFASVTTISSLVKALVKPPNPIPLQVPPKFIIYCDEDEVVIVEFGLNHKDKACKFPL